MADSIIELHQFTKDYGQGRGVFDVSLSACAGEVLGFLGANGAGKTVTMRSLMGFIKPTSGSVRIMGHDCFANRASIQGSLGYLPGEVACPDDMRARDFIRYVARMKGVDAKAEISELERRFDLDASMRMGSMSKGTKQKVAIICAFMGSPKVLLLDEPTSGLDPLMQDRFIELVCERRDAGATVLLSSHIFPEVERACDRVAFIRAGHLCTVQSMEQIHNQKRKLYSATFATFDAVQQFMALEHTGYNVLGSNAQGADISANNSAKNSALASPTASQEPLLEIEVSTGLNNMLHDLACSQVTNLSSREQTLEELFRHVYQKEERA